MVPRQEVKREPKAPQRPGEGSKPRLRIVRLEPRIAPTLEFRILANHNETPVRDRAETPRPGR